MSAPIRVAIVDDERLARERLRRLVQAEPDLEVTLVCRDGDEAVRGIVQERPELAFVDLQMPGRDGFGVVQALLEQLGPDGLPLIVFVTAYQEHALRAFDAQALDYLVKPFDDERFAATLARVRRRISQERLGAAAAQLGSALGLARGGGTPAPLSAQAEAPAGRLDRIVLKTGDRVRLAAAETVDWVEADGVYARLHLGAQSYLIRTPMHELESRLDGRRFARIHRGAIVNLDRVKELRELHRGEWEVVLADGTRLKLSRSRKAHLERLLGQSL
ncbi:LytR/AlgR family response regulator transcription factor [Longimicrobium sp.]|uniref:LytR/AlgR family response regulator transcription factor n=1 Tax=Longimicrobium sp. TaxID=2029185 RepID=UPI003B3A773E